LQTSSTEGKWQWPEQAISVISTLKQKISNDHKRKAHPLSSLLWMCFVYSLEPVVSPAFYFLVLNICSYHKNIVAFAIRYCYLDKCRI